MAETYQIEVGHRDDLIVIVFDNLINDREEYWIDATDSVTGKTVQLRLTDKGRKQLRKALKR